MIDPEKRKAIYLLNTEGMPVAEIARSLKVDPKTVRTIISQKGEMPNKTRSDTIHIEQQLLIDLYKKCDGFIERVHEKLEEDHGIQIGYSTLTRKIRELELGQPKNERCDQVEDQPGAEMQHDTSPYTLKIGDKKVNVVASLLYMRYSKVRYLKFYLSFNRFKMKCFLHEAMMFWGYSAPICIIDNTNLARLRGLGKNAVMVPEMEYFAKHYGFKFICHEKGHSNRKAGNERGFFTTETNFFPGRDYINLSDLNQQAFQWATVRRANKPVSKSGLIPARAFEYEQAYLNKLPPHISPPYIELSRSIDQYGYIPVNSNHYWIPGLKRFEVKVLKFQDHIKVYHKREKLIEYELKPEDVKNEKVYPPGGPKPRYQSNNRKKTTAVEEKKLRTASKNINTYLNFALADRAGKAKHHFIRRLYGLFTKMSLDLFDKTIIRALRYNIKDTETIEKIAILLMRESNYRIPVIDIDAEFKNRPAYIEGCFSEDVDLSIYQNFDEEEENG
ncbi:MAG: integrase family protein [Candidatus Magnetoglobus multicellularis str. Araruama]|uniref:Integrase family protein n=1 Tax=Candidatus Magnetoglobus multicellularis str. Araruama TaxID=890399 RepID=A0A1V1P3S3_9BACT|nr:MAG: integrase family protein [Candidatus Magnetoglobus multicellularis str. Araruama]